MCSDQPVMGVLIAALSAMGFGATFVSVIFGILFAHEKSLFYMITELSLQSSLLIHSFAIFTLLGSSWIWLPAIISIIIYSINRRNFSPLLYLALAFLISEGSVFILKVMVMRPRPYEVLTDVLLPIGAASGYSFPSGHATRIVALSMTLYSLFKKFFFVILVVQIFVLISRIMLGVHYPLDVLGGLFLGLIIWQLIDPIAVNLPIMFIRFRSFCSTLNRQDG